MTWYYLGHRGWGHPVEFVYLTHQNIAASISLFDLIVLTWAEITGHDGAILDALRHASAEDTRRSALAQAKVREAVIACWARDSRLAGGKEIDDEVRRTLIEILAIPERVKLVKAVQVALSRLACDIHTPTPCVLNSNFQEIGLLFRKPLSSFRSHMSSQAPPAALGDTGLSGIPDFTVLPRAIRDVEVEFVNPGASRGRRIGGGTKIAIGDFCNEGDKISSSVLYSSEGVDYPFMALEPDLTCAERLRRMVRDMDELGAQVGILPELTMTPELLHVLREAMQKVHDDARGANNLRLLVAGSQYEQVDASRVRNVTHVVFEDGYVLWSQEKLHPYEWPEGAPTHREPLDTRKRTVRLCDLWLGRATVSICLDYLVDDLSRLAEDLAVDCFFVPAMSSVTDQFSRRARDNVRRLKAATFVANTSCQLIPPNPQKGASLACLPCRGSENRIVQRLDLAAGSILYQIDIV